MASKQELDEINSANKASKKGLIKRQTLKKLIEINRLSGGYDEPAYQPPIYFPIRRTTPPDRA